jgi:hypothetical protein
VSNHLAIAHVTGALGQIAHAAAVNAVGGVGLGFGRPTSATSNRVNVYLYQIVTNAAQRNDDLPTRGPDGKVQQRPRAAIDLYFLLTFHGKPDQFEPERMAGAVVRELHTCPVLDPARLAAAMANSADLAGSDLDQAIERVRVTPMALSLDDTSRLWSVLVQTPHVLSLVYQASVVVIDALEGGPTPLPVLRRGEDGRGVETSLDRVPRLGEALIRFADVPERQPPLASLRAAQLGTIVVIEGTDLDGDLVELTFDHPRHAPFTLPIPPAQRSATELSFIIPDTPAAASAWAAGLYRVTVQVVREGKALTGPVWPLLLAPRLKALAPSAPGPVGANIPVTATVTPLLLPSQAAAMRVGSVEIAAQPSAVATDQPVFVLDPAPALADALVRIIVDGVESMPALVDPATGEFAFDPAQRLTIS